MDAEAEPGYSLRALSDAGMLVRSGIRGVLVHDVVQGARVDVQTPVDLGDRAIFRSDYDLVVLRGGTVASVDVRTLE